MGRPKKSEHQKLNPPRRQMKRKRNDLHVHFSSYVFRVLKQVHPQLSMTNKAMKVMDDFMHDIFHRLADEAAGLMKVANRSTLTSAEIQTATRLILPGELSKHAVIEATKSLATFIRSRSLSVCLLTIYLFILIGQWTLVILRHSILLLFILHFLWNF